MTISNALSGRPLPAQRVPNWSSASCTTLAGEFPWIRMRHCGMPSAQRGAGRRLLCITRQRCCFRVRKQMPSGAQACILEQSTKQGFFLAQTVLGNYLFEGRLLGRDVDESLRLLQSAAEQGDRNALFNLGRIYDGGINLDAPDTERAKAYFSEAARLGHPQAQSYLRDPL